MAGVSEISVVAVAQSNNSSSSNLLQEISMSNVIQKNSISSELAQKMVEAAVARAIALVTIFAASAIAAGSGYAIGGLMMSLGAQIAHDLVGSDNALVNGVAIALFALAAGVVAIPGKRLTPRAAITVGAVSSIVGTALLALSTARHALPTFVAAAAAGGIGFSSNVPGRP
jgi:hypothetical protein